jgi:flagella basal body P-ring formation protein FlgA
MRRAVLVLTLLAASEVAADILVPVRMIRAREIVAAADLIPDPATIAGALSDPADLIGQEAQVALYPGRPIRPGDVGPPALVDRNDLIVLVFRRGGLSILADGRSLGRGAVGDRIRAMNMDSRVTVSGRILADGTVEVE